MAFPGGAHIGVVRQQSSAPAPVMQLDFLNNATLPDRVTFSRGTGATRVNQSGFIETVGNTTPRFDYDPVTLAPRGLLIEEARTNLLTYSQDWTNAAWSKTNITVTAAATASPDGTVNAQRLQATASAVTNNVSPSATVAATAASFSVYVKQGTGATTANSFAIRNVTTATTLILGTLNYNTGAFTYSVGSTGVTVINAGNGWWRIVLTATSGITSGDSLAGYVGFVGGAQTAGDHLFAYGAQLEAGSFATSYIPTVASTVTRNADVATMTGTNFSSWYNQSEGTFVYDASALSGLYGYRALLIARAAGGITDRIDMSMGAGAGGATGVFRDIVAVAGVTQVDIGDFANFAGNTAYKGALSYKLNDFAAATSGGNLTTDTSGTVPTVALLDLGNRNSANFLNGHIRTIAYFNTRLPNSQLQTLTAPSLATTLSLDFTSGSYNVGF